MLVWMLQKKTVAAHHQNFEPPSLTLNDQSSVLSSGATLSTEHFTNLYSPFDSLLTLYTTVTCSEDKCLDYLKQAKLIPTDNLPCPRCVQKHRKGILKYTQFSSGGDRKCNLRLLCTGVGKRCTYKVSPFSGTFFDGVTCRIPIATVLHIIYCWLHSVPIQHAIRECQVNKNTITDYYNYCREVCALSLTKDSCQIGGPGEVVEIDESKFYTRKYHRGRVLSGTDGWVFGGIQRSNKECFMVRVKDRSKDTLLPLIEQYIKPGSIIISDEWRSYADLTSKGYKHLTVCHKRNFVDPKDPIVHTQNIEISWRYAKAIYPERSTSEELPDSYLQEFLYRRKHKGKFIQQFLCDLAEIYRHKAM